MRSRGEFLLAARTLCQSPRCCGKQHRQHHGRHGIGTTKTITTDGLDRGISSTLAEFLVHLALLDIDESARHLGGNYRGRDHEILDNTAWIDTKTAWFDTPDRIGYSPVNWGSARDPNRPERVLDAVALVPLREGELTIKMIGARSVNVSIPEFEWYLVPASVLYEHREVETKCRESAPSDDVQTYRVDAGNPLTADRLKGIIAASSHPVGA